MYHYVLCSNYISHNETKKKNTRNKQPLNVYEDTHHKVIPKSSITWAIAYGARHCPPGVSCGGQRCETNGDCNGGRRGQKDKMERDGWLQKYKNCMAILLVAQCHNRCDKLLKNGSIQWTGPVETHCRVLHPPWTGFNFLRLAPHCTQPCSFYARCDISEGFMGEIDFQRPWVKQWPRIIAHFPLSAFLNMKLLSNSPYSPRSVQRVGTVLFLHHSLFIPCYISRNVWSV